jgi:hypothetical protein
MCKRRAVWKNVWESRCVRTRRSANVATRLLLAGGQEIAELVEIGRLDQVMVDTRGT